MTGKYLPLATFDMVQIGMGQAVFIIGLLALLALLGVQLRNPAALVSLGIAIIVIVLSTVLGLGTEWFWLTVIVTALLVLVGAVVRWNK